MGAIYHSNVIDFQRSSLLWIHKTYMLRCYTYMYKKNVASELNLFIRILFIDRILNDIFIYALAVIFLYNYSMIQLQCNIHQN